MECLVVILEQSRHSARKKTYILSGTITLGLNNDPSKLARRSTRGLLADIRAVLPLIDGVSELEFGRRTTRIVFKVLVCKTGLGYVTEGPSRVEVVLIN